MLSDPGLGAVGPRLTYEDGTTQWPCARRLPTVFQQFAQALARGSRAAGAATYYPASAYAEAFEPEALSGACMLVRRDAWNTVGGFDERYFLYGEDLKLCWDLRKAGWRLAYEPQSRCTHLLGRSAVHRGGLVYVERSSMLLFLSQTEGRARGLLGRVAVAVQGARVLLGAALGRNSAASWVLGYCRAAGGRLAQREFVALVETSESSRVMSAETLLACCDDERRQHGSSVIVMVDLSAQGVLGESLRAHGHAVVDISTLDSKGRRVDGRTRPDGYRVGRRETFCLSGAPPVSRMEPRSASSRRILEGRDPESVKSAPQLPSMS